MTDHPTTEARSSVSAVTFTVTHGCRDGRERDLYWEHDAFDRRVWLYCPDCKYAVKLVSRWPSGRIEDPEQAPSRRTLYSGRNARLRDEEAR